MISLRRIQPTIVPQLFQLNIGPVGNEGAEGVISSKAELLEYSRKLKSGIEISPVGKFLSSVEVKESNSSYGPAFWMEIKFCNPAAKRSGYSNGDFLYYWVSIYRDTGSRCCQKTLTKIEYSAPVGGCVKGFVLPSSLAMCGWDRYLKPSEINDHFGHAMKGVETVFRLWNTYGVSYREAVELDRDKAKAKVAA